MPRNIKKPGPAGKLTQAARECYDKGISQNAARAFLIKHHKAAESVAKVTVSHVYNQFKADLQQSSPPKPKSKIIKNMTPAEKDELIEMLLPKDV